MKTLALITLASALCGLSTHAFADKDTAFHLHNSTGMNVQLTCSPASHFKDCNPSVVEVYGINNSLQTQSTITTSPGHTVCTVHMSEHTVAAHGHSASWISINSVIPGTGYTCTFGSQSVTIGKA